MILSGQQRVYGDESPIAALATGIVPAALAIIRVTGKRSLELLCSVFSRPTALNRAIGNTVIYGKIITPGEKTRIIDEVLVSVYRAPASYTGEDGADISCHGGGAVVKAVMETLKTAGFHDALPGEFTFRAFINGKLDLTRAESVTELVAAKTDAARERAVKRLSGELESTIRAINESLVLAIAEVELHLDYSEMDGIDDNVSGLPSREKIEAALIDLDTLCESYIGEKLYREGLRIVIAGRTNAGKSSLFNAMLREDRSIVTDTPGTTRDWLEGWISLDGIPICLFDTAGLRDSDTDIEVAEKIGIDRSRSLISEADMVIYVIDGTDFQKDQAEYSRIDDERLVLVRNKSDIMKNNPDERFIDISAATGSGIKELFEKIKASVMKLYAVTQNTSQSRLGSERQKELVDTARISLRHTIEMADLNEPLDIIAPEIREAINALGEITGEVSNSDILEKMFSQFCVGK